MSRRRQGGNVLLDIQALQTRAATPHRNLDYVATAGSRTFADITSYPQVPVSQAIRALEIQGEFGHTLLTFVDYDFHWSQIMLLLIRRLIFWQWIHRVGFEATRSKESRKSTLQTDRLRLASMAIVCLDIQLCQAGERYMIFDQPTVAQSPSSLAQPWP